MPASLIEIIQLPSGEIEVRRVDGSSSKNAEPVVKLTFSDEALEFMGDAAMEIARVMVQAGLDAVSEIMDEMEDDLENAEEDARPQGFSQRTVH